MRRMLWFLMLIVAAEAVAQVSRDTVLLDFGAPGPPQEVNYNLVSSPAVGPFGALITTCGAVSTVELTISDDFTGTNRSGTPTSGVVGWDLPTEVSEDSFFGNPQLFGGVENPTAGLELRGDFDTLSLSFFASRLASDNRQTCYRVTGQDTVVACLQVANNEDEVVSVQVVADATGLVRVDVYPGPDNDNANGFFYLGALRVVGELVDRDSSRSLEFLYPAGGEYFAAGSTVPLRWRGSTGCTQFLGFTIGEGQLIDTLAFAASGRQTFAWRVPDTVTTDARIVYGLDTSAPGGGVRLETLPFSIGRDTQRCRIVVLGSSTAAGTGPSVRDSAWVWRFRENITATDNRVEVINLARGGYNTFKLLPNDAAIPAGINQTIDSARNLSAAVALNPEVIVINLPSNDAALGVDVAQQLDNYRLMVEAAGSIPVYVTTPQPRNFDSTRIAIQLALLDSTFARFGERTLDFWTPFATAEGRVAPLYDSGDGVHLNNAAHRIMLQRVLAKSLDTLLTCQRPSSLQPTRAEHALPLDLINNPTRDESMLRVTPTVFSRLTLEIFDLHGRLVWSAQQRAVLGQQSAIPLRAADVGRGVYVVRVTEGPPSAGRRGSVKWVVE